MKMFFVKHRLFCLMVVPGVALFGVKWWQKCSLLGNAWEATERMLMPVTVYALVVIVVMLRIRIYRLTADIRASRTNLQKRDNL